MHDKALYVQPQMRPEPIEDISMMKSCQVQYKYLVSEVIAILEILG